MRPALSRLTSQLGPAKLAALVAAVVVVAIGGTLGAVYAVNQARPTTVSLDLKDGARNVATDRALGLSFSRPVAYEQVRGGLAFEPATGGSLYSDAGRTRYTFKPASAWADLTTYRVSLRSLTDTSGHRTPQLSWRFTTTIVPRVTGVTDQDGNAIAEGAQVPTRSQLILTFNDAMNESTITPLVDAQPATVHWHDDAMSVRVFLTHTKIGPLTISIAGGRDQTGHAFRPWTLHASLAFVVRVHTTALPYPALIQVPNDSSAWDQSGLQSASMVFEYDTEGGIRRMTGLFTSIPDAVGPIRSGRLISFKLVRHYHGMLFLSGLSNGSMRVFNQSPVPALFDTDPPFYRTGDRYPPNNLFISGSGVLAAEQRENVAPWQLPYGTFSFPSGSDGGSFQVGEHDSQYTFDPDTSTYTKTESGHLMSDAAVGDSLHIAMVVVIHTTETPTSYVEDVAGAHGLDFDMQSGGRAEFYYGGTEVTGTWNGSDIHNPLTFKSSGGQEITLPPGLVWVDVVR